MTIEEPLLVLRSSSPTPLGQRTGLLVEVNNLRLDNVVLLLDYGDGSTPERVSDIGTNYSASRLHSYATGGMYGATARLVSADDENEVYAETTMRVAITKPSLSLEHSMPIELGNTIFFTATLSGLAMDDATLVIDFGDGNTKRTTDLAIGRTNDASVEHTYTEPGTYTVVARLEDATGKEVVVYENVVRFTTREWAVYLPLVRR